MPRMCLLFLGRHPMQPIIIKDELEGLLQQVKKSGSVMHLWGPSYFYDCMDRDCLKPFARAETNPKFSQSQASKG